ncbi:hypothetical protein JYT36_00460 [Bacteroidales bacterium AH-315-N07]|nr:hypothetical protein [Bacteroidales bacterium AH-315-N07]
MRNILMLFILLIYVSSVGYTQDRILTLKGKIIDTKIIDVSDDIIKYKLYRKQSSGTKSIKSARVFMITYDNGKEKTIYKKKKRDPESLEPDNMRMMISGIQDGRQYFKARGNFVWGIVVGFVGGIVRDLRYAPIPPVLFATISEMHAPCLSKQQLSYCFDLCNEDYVTGYMKQAGNKKVNNSLLGGLIGIVGGYLFVTTLNIDPIGDLGVILQSLKKKD